MSASFATRPLTVGVLELGVDARLGPWINGEMVEGGGLEAADRSPATGEVLALVRVGSREDLRTAVEAADGAAPGWRRLGMPERAARVHELASRLKAVAEQFGLCDALDTGSPKAAMTFGAQKGAAQLGAVAGVGLEVQGRTIPATPTGWHLTKREPFGVVGAIAAYNHPTLFACQKIGAALVTGNTVVLKPSEQAPLTALALAALSEDLLPPGVLNVVPGGADVGAALVEHPRVLRLSFTGSVPTGIAVQKAAANSDLIKHVTLELGGKNPMIVLPDVPAETAADAVVKGMNFTRVQGQSCGSTSRLLLPESMHDEVLELVIERISSIRLGMPDDDATQMGSLVSHEHRERVLSFVDGAIADGARLVAGGGPPDDREDLAGGAFVAPTVLDGVHQDMHVAQNEIFGPVLSVISWCDLDDALAMANDVPYGLTASVWTNDLATAMRCADQLEAGYVWINDVETRYTGVPFGGWKQSGRGSEQGLVHELEEYTRIKAINIGQP